VRAVGTLRRRVTVSAAARPPPSVDPVAYLRERPPGGRYPMNLAAHLRKWPPDGHYALIGTLTGC